MNIIKNAYIWMNRNHNTFAVCLVVLCLLTAVIPATAEAVAVFLVAIIAVFAAGDNSKWWLEVKDLFE